MNRKIRYMLFVLSVLFVAWQSDCRAANPDTFVSWADSIQTVSMQPAQRMPHTIYAHPYSLSYSSPDAHRMWINTATLSAAFVGSLLVLECLPEGATNWNRHDIQSVPLFKRWYRNVFKRGPEWDGDKFYFNYLLHPYAGAAYYMSARSCGYNAYQSLLYSALISTVGWEFGIEAFMERPSYQDLFVTPLVGSALGEGFYRAKRYIVDHGYRLFGSRLIGTVAAWLVDPVNEFVGLFAGNPAIGYASSITCTACCTPRSMTLSMVF